MTRAPRYIGGGLHPDAKYGDVVHVETERSRDSRRAARAGLAHTDRRAARPRGDAGPGDRDPHLQPAARLHLPLLQALAAHSPYWFGVDSGMACARSPSSAPFRAPRVPQAFPTTGSTTKSSIRWCVATGEIPDYTYVWWDIRPSPNLGTVEVRAMDAQSRLEQRRRARGARPRARGRLRRRRRGARAPDRGDHRVLVPRRPRRDRRHGLVARRAAADPRGRRRRAGDRPPYARELDGEDALEEIERILREGGGADRMRAAHAAGGLNEVLAGLAAETYGSTQTTSPIRSQS